MTKLYTAKDLAKELPIGEHKLRRLSKECLNFPCLKIGNRTLFTKEDVEAWLLSQAKMGVRI